MAIYAEIVDLDGVYESSPRQPLNINDFDINSEEDKEEFNRLIMSQYGSDFLELEPSCDCGYLKGGHNRGITCPKCSTEVSTVTERNLETVTWISLPKGVRAFINPKVYSIMSKYLIKGRFNMLNHLINPTMRGPETNNPIVKRYMKLNIPRGINYFHDNFDEIIDTLVENNIIQKDDKDKQDGSGKRDALIQFLKVYRDIIFCHHLPLPTKLMMVTEKSMGTTFASSNIFLAIDAVRIISDVENATVRPSDKKLQSEAMKANVLMAEYSEKSFNDFFDHKTGWFRQHVYGTRSHFTFRAVINSLTERHDYWELHLPWSLSVMAFRIHLMSKLLKRGWALRDAQDLLEEHTLKYHPLLDELFQELIYEAPGHRLPILFLRNPSLLRGSVQLLYLTKVKTDVDIRSISISVLILKTYNADFDGDALNGMIVLDNRMLRKVSRLESHLTILDTNKPRTLSATMQMPRQVVSIAGSWLHRET